MATKVQHNYIFWEKLGEIPFGEYDITSSFEKALKNTFPHIIPPEEQKLIAMAFNNELNQGELDNFLQNWDIECYGAEGALLLSYIQKKFPQLDFKDYTGPRLNGLFNYYRFRNLELIAQYKKIVEKLNENNIFPIIMKGGALKHLRPELPRIMGDIDILVPEPKQFEQAVQIITNMGYEIFCDAGHSIDFHKPGNQHEGILDIHRRIDDLINNRDILNQRILSRAKLQKVFQTQSYVPCAEDLVFISLFHLVKDLTEGSNFKNVMYTVFDMAYFTGKPDFDWQTILQNAKDTGTGKYIYLAITLINALVPDLLPESIRKSIIEDEKICDALDNDYFYARFVHKVKHARKNIRFISTLNKPKELKRYITGKIQYIFIKRIYKMSWLIKAVFAHRRKVKKWNI